MATEQADLVYIGNRNHTINDHNLFQKSAKIFKTAVKPLTQMQFI